MSSEEKEALYQEFKKRLLNDLALIEHVYDPSTLEIVESIIKLIDMSKDNE